MKLNRSNYDNIWFTSDWHIHHDRPFIVQQRGFAHIKEHDEFLVDTYNSLVKKRDIVFNMGDLLFGRKTDCWKLINSLNCSNQYFIRGNHDKALGHYLQEFPAKSIGNLKEITITEDEDRYPITLTHYSMLSWNKSHYGAWNLCGHSHGSLPESLPDHVVGKRCDVGVDVGLKFNDKFMFTFEDVKHIMGNKIKTEHH